MRREARDAAFLKSLSQEMNEANRNAGEIVTYVGMGRGDMALLRTRDLMNQTSYILAR